jgi:diadenosine tetraphosphate (Ap4A) HIT family hydrolase
MSEDEVLSCNQLIKKMKNKIQELDSTVDGFNIGTNSGKLAGQSIMHCHIHLIPRRKNDVDNPQGGVRGVIPSKQHYQRKK